MKDITVYCYRSNKKIDRASSRILFAKSCEKHFSNGQVPVRGCRSDGKPVFLDFPEEYFSVTHTENLFFCAFCTGAEIGFDAEFIRNKKLDRNRIISRFYTPVETDMISNSADHDREFCRIWTKKEATVKFTGQGIGGLRNTDEFEKKLSYCDISAELQRITGESEIVATLCCESAFRFYIHRQEDFTDD